MKQSRAFLKGPQGELKKIYSIRVDDKGKFLQAQVWSTIICKELGIPLDSEIHYQIPANGKDFHLTINYKDSGPFEDPEIKIIENYLHFYPNRPEYDHKQVIVRIEKTTHKHTLPFTNELKPKYLIGCSPEAFDCYLENKVQHPVYFLPSIGTPIAPLTDEKLKNTPWENGDPSDSPLSDNDIVIEESNEPDARVTVCGFISCPESFPKEQLLGRLSRQISIPGLPDFGISVLFCHKLPKT